jgi:hypothetical protein
MQCMRWIFQGGCAGWVECFTLRVNATSNQIKFSGWHLCLLGPILLLRQSLTYHLNTRLPSLLGLRPGTLPGREYTLHLGGEVRVDKCHERLWHGSKLGGSRGRLNPFLSGLDSKCFGLRIRPTFFFGEMTALLRLLALCLTVAALDPPLAPGGLIVVKVEIILSVASPHGAPQGRVQGPRADRS